LTKGLCRLQRLAELYLVENGIDRTGCRVGFEHSSQSAQHCLGLGEKTLALRNGISFVRSVMQRSVPEKVEMWSFSIVTRSFR